MWGRMLVQEWQILFSMSNKAGETVLLQYKEGCVLWESVKQQCPQYKRQIPEYHRLCSKPRGCGSGAKPFYLRIDNPWHSYFSLCHLCVLCAPAWEGPSCAAKGCSNDCCRENHVGRASRILKSSLWMVWHWTQQSFLHMDLQRASKNSRNSLRAWRELFFSCLFELAFEIQQMKRMTLALEVKNLLFNAWQYLSERASGKDKQAQC